MKMLQAGAAVFKEDQAKTAPKAPKNHYLKIWFNKKPTMLPYQKQSMPLCLVLIEGLKNIDCKFVLKKENLIGGGVV
jgi:hypothetical protein